MSSKPISDICLKARWDITHKNTETGEILYHELSDNLIVKVGKGEILKLLFNLSGSTFLFMGAGASSTAATVDDTQLVYEHILNATRKSLTNTSNAALSGSDVINNAVVISSVNYYKQITVRSTYDGSTDSNVNQPFQEYGLFSTATLPGTPTGSSGNMFNRFIGSQQIILTNVTTIVADVVIHS